MVIGLMKPRQKGMRFMKEKRRFRFLGRLLFVLAALCLLPLCREYYLSAEHQREQKRLKESLLSAEQTITPGGTVTPAADKPEQEAVTPEGTLMPEGSITPGGAPGTEQTGPTSVPLPTEEPAAEPVMLKRFERLYAENHDLVAWLSIEGTEIDYPVMQCGDDEYYLNHSFYRKESKYGCLYVRERADVHTPGTNFIIYGHNMKDGAMFGNLELYQKESYFLEHPVISFDTLYEERRYEILAVFRSQVYRQDENVFQYYQFYEADTPEEFASFYQNIKSLSLYDTGVTAEFGDTFLTLSTCAYHVEDGRFVVVAKRAGREE